MDALECAFHRSAYSLCTLELFVPSMLGFGFIEGGSFESFGQRRGASTLVDRGLRALGLELVQDDREGGYLGFAQVQFVRQKA